MAARWTTKFMSISTYVGIIFITALYSRGSLLYNSLNIVCAAPFLYIQFLAQIILFFFFFYTVQSTSAQSIFVIPFITVWTISRIFCDNIAIFYLSMVVTLLTATTRTNENYKCKYTHVVAIHCQSSNAYYVTEA